MFKLTVNKISELKAVDIEKTIEFLDSCPAASAYQFPYAEMGHDLLFQVVEGGEIRFSGRGHVGYLASRYCPFLRVLSFNRGPVASLENDYLLGLRLIKDWAKQNGCIRVEISPDFSRSTVDLIVGEMEEMGWKRLPMPKRHTLRTEIAGTEDDILNGFSKSGRYQVRRAAREGIYTRLGDSVEHVEAFIRLRAEMSMRKNLGLSDGPIKALWKLKVDDPTRMALVMAYFENELLGANLVFRCGELAEYLYGAVRKGAKVLHGDVSAGYPLQYAGLLWARSVGCASYDFGGFTPGANSGPAFMKKSCVRDPVPLELSPRIRLELWPTISNAVSLLHRIARKR